jgi:hypothetical protein
MERARRCKSDGWSQKLKDQMERARRCKIRWKELEAVRSDGNSQEM